MSNWEVFDESASSEDADLAKYLLFMLGGSLYGTPLLGVREVVEPQAIKIVPNTVRAFRGLINIRGQIIAVIDLREMFGYAPDDQAGEAFLVFETENGSIAAIVDKVEAVGTVLPDSIDRHPNIQSQSSGHSLIGATTYQGHILTLVDLQKAFSQFNLAEIHSQKLILS